MILATLLLVWQLDVQDPPQTNQMLNDCHPEFVRVDAENNVVIWSGDGGWLPMGSSELAVELTERGACGALIEASDQSRLGVVLDVYEAARSTSEGFIVSLHRRD